MFLAAQQIVDWLPQRSLDAHKGDCGHVGIVAGSTGKIGAGILAGLGALRTGCGLATYILPDGIFSHLDNPLPELMWQPVPGQDFFSPNSVPKTLESLQAKASGVLGPGIGTHRDTAKFLEKILTTPVPWVLDADALNLMAAHPSLSCPANAVLTPHPGEMARLMGSTPEDVQKHREDMSQTLSQKRNAIVVLKGHHTVIAGPDGTFYNPTGNPGMASAGMGDVLSGVIAGFLAQGLSPMRAACVGVYLHGLAGDLAAKTIGLQGFLASDVANAIPKAIASLLPKGRGQ